VSRVVAGLTVQVRFDVTDLVLTLTVAGRAADIARTADRRRADDLTAEYGVVSVTLSASETCRFADAEVRRRWRDDLATKG
jgi:hypothetical protein